MSQANHFERRRGIGLANAAKKGQYVISGNHLGVNVKKTDPGDGMLSQ